jgi:phosphohistidine swiveling domain-containing protein
LKVCKKNKTKAHKNIRLILSFKIYKIKGGKDSYFSKTNFMILSPKSNNNNDIIKKLDKHNWSLLGLWHGSLLYLYLERVGQAREYYKKNRINFELKNNPVINNEESYIEIKEEKKLIRKLQKNAQGKQFLKNHSKYCLKRIEDIKNFSVHFYKTKFTLFDNKRLLLIFFNLTKLFKNNMPFIYTIYYLCDILEKQAKYKLKKIGVPNDKIEDYFVSLTYPLKLNFLKQEEKSFLKLASSMSDSREKEKAINRHYNKYFWLNVYSFEGEFLKKDYFSEKLKKPFNPQKKIKKLCFIREKRINVIKEFIQKYKPSHRLMEFFNLIGEYNYLRDMRYDIFNFSFGYMFPLFEELTQRLKLKSWKEVVYLTPEEITDSLNKRITSINRNKIKERQKGFSIIMVDGKIKVCSGKDNIKFISYFNKFKKDRIKVDKNILKGIIGNSGLYRGKVKIALSISDFSNLRKDCALVVKMIPPDLTRVKMTHCGAIIADLGGSLSHAAILAREFKIPCVVGTGNATKILKDGDLVEVDANKGVVKILKK